MMLNVFIQIYVHAFFVIVYSIPVLCAINGFSQYDLNFHRILLE